jgi:hypothetical protein
MHHPHHAADAGRTVLLHEVVFDRFGVVNEYFYRPSPVEERFAETTVDVGEEDDEIEIGSCRRFSTRRRTGKQQAVRHFVSRDEDLGRCLQRSGSFCAFHGIVVTVGCERHFSVTVR